jgi:hypothetical protein
MSLSEYHGVDRRRANVARPLTPTPIQLIVHCIAERKDDNWQAFSLEFGLAAQGENLADTKHRLEAMILSYVYDALIGEDREHALALLTRKATWNVYAKYYLANLMSRAERVWGASKNTILFSEPLPLAPTCTQN